MKRAVALPLLATMFVLMVLQTTLPIQTSEAASQITVPRDYPTIQSAINAASPGDTIKVLPGTYDEQLIISNDLTLIGTGDRVTIIQIPTKLPDTAVNGDQYIVDVRTGANVNMKGFTISGLSSSSCPDLIGINVMESASLNLAFSTIRDCTRNGIFVEGDVTVTWTTIKDYRDQGIFGFGEGSTIKASHSNIVAAQKSENPSQIGILLDAGANGVIDHNRVSLSSVAGSVAKLTTTP
jgi:hypothetical protein